MAALMDEPVLVSLSQWIGWTKKLGIENSILIGARDGCAKSENESESYQFHKKREGLLHIFRRWDIRRR